MVVVRELLRLHLHERLQWGHHRGAERGRAGQQVLEHELARLYFGLCSFSSVRFGSRVARVRVRVRMYLGGCVGGWRKSAVC